MNTVNKLIKLLQKAERVGLKGKKLLGILYLYQHNDCSKNDLIKYAKTTQSTNKQLVDEGYMYSTGSKIVNNNNAVATYCLTPPTIDLVNDILKS